MLFEKGKTWTDQQEDKARGIEMVLEEKAYARLRQRIVDLVKSSADALRKDRQRLSLSTVAEKSRELDVEGNGKEISESAILDNYEAWMYYEHHRSWRGSPRKQTKLPVVAGPPQSLMVKPGRDEQQVRQRYRRNAG